MHITIFISVLIAAFTGLVAKFILDKKNTQKEITWKEYGIVMVVIAFLAAPGSVYVGWEIAKKNLITFNEYWGGWELKTQKEIIDCYRDGPCRWEYDCDPYLVSYPCNCDDKGNCSTCYRTEYHDCPYVTQENSYYIKTTIGTYTIDSNRFPDNPQSHRWRSGERIPDYIIERAGVGDPVFWQEAKKRIDSGNPGPVTKRMEYDNYIYASEQSLLKSFSADIDDYEKKGLFPIFQKNIYNFYYANKVYFVGFNPDNQKEWFDAMSYFDAAFRTNLQGDMHLVIVKNEYISSDPDRYALALKAYWQDKKRHGKDVLSKNAVVIICTTDGEKIIWARSFTGMPLGNESMLVALDNGLRGINLNSETLIGKTIGKLKNGKVESIHSDGVIEKIVFGLIDPSTKFKRVSMSAKDKDDNGRGFFYLVQQIQPTSGQRIFIYIGTFLFCSMGWIAAVIIGDRR